MRYKYLWLLIVPIALFSCKKNDYPTPPPPDPPVTPILLKEIVIPNLPSPYYHFKYDADGKAIFASFASGLLMYDIAYVGGKISTVQSKIPVNMDKLQYFYDNAGRANAVWYVDSSGFVFRRVLLTYDGQKLVKFEREYKAGGSFSLDKRMTMTYHADGNLKELTTYRPSINGLPEATYTDRYDDYDNKTKVDAFILLHEEFFDHLVLLPGVQLQKNNPRKLSRTGDGANFLTDYFYTYNDKNLPLTRRGEALVVSGPKAGDRFQTNSAYSYY